MEMTPTAALEDTGEQWIALSPTERESFLTAIERHRKAAWRVTAVSAIGIVIAAFVVAVLMAPLFYALLGLVFDVANIVTPTPNLLGDFILVGVLLPLLVMLSMMLSMLFLGLPVGILHVLLRWMGG